MNGTYFSKLTDGTWGVTIRGDLGGNATKMAGQTVTVTKKNGGTSTVRLGARIDSWNGGRAASYAIARDSANDSYRDDAARIDAANADAYMYGASGEPTPASDPDHLDCDGCRGDGVHFGAGYVLNGKFVGHTGTCYRCGGKGYQTRADAKRNAYYDNHVRRISV
jgi:hypothetical protein